jgi:hypothetical protein
VAFAVSFGYSSYVRFGYWTKGGVIGEVNFGSAGEPLLVRRPPFHFGQPSPRLQYPLVWRMVCNWRGKPAPSDILDAEGRAVPRIATFA